MTCRNSLREHGYLDREFATPCVIWDEVNAGDLGAELATRLGLPERADALWPLQSAAWDEDTFYDLVEVFHDLVARPRHTVSCQDEDDVCGPHYTDHDTEAGRRIYRYLVNQLLDEHGVEFRLAEAGEDTGRLVRSIDAARAELIEHTLQTPEPIIRDRVDHAVSLFRRRGATEHEKRSAATALALVLEERRALLKHELLSKDEGALFQIANQFAVRHQRDGQRDDYDAAFRDWVFWWFLATIELTNRVLDRQDAGSP